MIRLGVACVILGVENVVGWRYFVLGVAMMAGLMGISRSGRADQALPTVKGLDLERYMGTWYEISRYPNRWQAGCFETVAEYERRADGSFDVRLTCHRGSFDGPVRTHRAVAKVADEHTQAKLFLQLFWPVRTPYWVIDLDPDYQWAVIGEPDRDLLWIIARQPTLDDETRAAIRSRLEEVGYDPDRLVDTPQRP